MIILAIETSCDETAISVVECSGGFKNPRFKIFSNVVASQIKIHRKWGGVVPNLAKREHIRNLPIVLNKALRKAGFVNTKSQKTNSKQIPKFKFKIPNIDLIAVTVGPGLEPALWTGINFAKDLAEKWNKPIIGVNHLEGHIFSVLLRNNSSLRVTRYAFPMIALLVSGGHTELVLMRKWLDYKIIGQTRDDAAGEAFDKVAKMLGLPYPGGPEISKYASKIQPGKIPSVKERSGKTLGIAAPATPERSDGGQEEGWQINLPRPMINFKNYDFSFSGLKTAVLYLIKDLKKNIPKFSDRKDLVSSICSEFQQAVIDVLISKTIAAAKEHKVKTIILGGGVAANQELRKQIAETIKKEIPRCALLVPRYEFTTDNAAMIAAAAYFHRDKIKSKKLKADGNLSLSTRQ